MKDAATTATDVAVIGAGPYGLSVAAHLLGSGTDIRVFGRPMDTWRGYMPVGMLLKSEGFASNLSDPAGRHTLQEFADLNGKPYRQAGFPVPLDTFSQYGMWFQQELVPDIDQSEIVRLDARPGHFELTSAAGETVRARRVVVAVGTTYFSHVPEQLRHLPPDQLSHTSQHTGFERFRGRHVTVIGGGQSALETAALLNEGGASVRLLVRDAALAWNPDPDDGTRSLTDLLRCPTAALCGCGWRCVFHSEGAGLFHHLPLAVRQRVVRSTFGPAGAWWLRSRLDGQVETRLNSMVLGAESRDGRVLLDVAVAGGERLRAETDHVIAGTGYRIDVGTIPFLAPELAARLGHVGGSPVLSRFFESSVPGLYFVGLAAANEFGPSMRFVYGAAFAARRLARHLSGARSPVAKGHLTAAQGR